MPQSEATHFTGMRFLSYLSAFTVGIDSPNKLIRLRDDSGSPKYIEMRYKFGPIDGRSGSLKPPRDGARAIWSRLSGCATTKALFRSEPYHAGTCQQAVQ